MLMERRGQPSRGFSTVLCGQSGDEEQTFASPRQVLVFPLTQGSRISNVRQVPSSTWQAAPPGTDRKEGSHRQPGTAGALRAAGGGEGRERLRPDPTRASTDEPVRVSALYGEAVAEGLMDPNLRERECLRMRADREEGWSERRWDRDTHGREPVCIEARPVLGPVERPSTLVLCEEGGPVRRATDFGRPRRRARTGFARGKSGGIATGGVATHRLLGTFDLGGPGCPRDNAVITAPAAKQRPPSVPGLSAS